MIYETIIVGAGIGGISAGIYAARKRMEYLIVSDEIGGQMYESGEILNYPGVVKATGAEFAETFSKQMEFNNLKVREERVVSLKKLENKNWEVATDKSSYETKTVIIASGSHPRKLNVPGEERLARKGVTYCAVCDGPLFAGKDVAIVGGGNSALEAADFMSRIAGRIYLITVNPEMKGHEYLLEKVAKLRNLSIITRASVKEIKGAEFVSGVVYEQDGKEKQIAVNAVIIEIGRIPSIDFVKGVVDMDEHNHIKVDRWARCFINGREDDSIYAVGDCSDVHEYQYVISAGMGVTALLKAARHLAKSR